MHRYHASKNIGVENLIGTNLGVYTKVSLTLGFLVLPLCYDFFVNDKYRFTVLSV